VLTLTICAALIEGNGTEAVSTTDRVISTAITPAVDAFTAGP
jgi:hypothetical protein